MKMFCFAIAAFTALLTSSSVQALTHKYPCDELIYDALTMEGGKRLQLCKSKGQVNYNYGLANGKSELDVLFPVTLMMLYPGEEKVIEMYRGNYAYILFDDKLMVTRSEEVLAEIDLKRPIVDHAFTSLLPYGVPVYN